MAKKLSKDQKVFAKHYANGGGKGSMGGKGAVARIGQSSGGGISFTGGNVVNAPF